MNPKCGSPKISASSRMRNKSASGVLDTREAYLGSMSQPILQRETNDVSRTTDEGTAFLRILRVIVKSTRRMSGS